MKITSKNCPNCGAGIEFNIGDNMTMCSYCNSQINIDWEHKHKNEQNSLSLNRNWEIFKWIYSLIHVPIILLIGIILLTCSDPQYGLILIIGGILSIPNISKIIYKKHKIIKFIVIELLIVIGFIGGILNIFPININSKMYSSTTNMTIKINGNYIIIETDGKKIKERYKCEKELSIMGVDVYKITTSRYTFKFSHSVKDESGINDKFYMVDKYGQILEEFYTKEQLNLLNYLGLLGEYA